MAISISQAKKFKNGLRFLDGSIEMAPLLNSRTHSGGRDSQGIVNLHDYDGNGEDQSDGNKYLQFEM